MKIRVRGVSFGYAGNPVFENLYAEFDDGEHALPGGGEDSPRGAAPSSSAAAMCPLVVLGPSGCGKTTFLKLLGGLLKPEKGEIIFQDRGPREEAAAFIFQEPRLLPWMTVLENVSLPLLKITGREAARERARHFLALVSLGEKERAYPAELSGGEAQRVSMARAFAWPSSALFMDEPFQSLDVPLRRKLMALTLSLLEKERRFLVAVTHDPREARYLGGRAIVLGRGGRGIVFDRVLDPRASGPDFASNNFERELTEALENAANQKNGEPA